MSCSDFQIVLPHCPHAMFRLPNFLANEGASVCVCVVQLTTELTQLGANNNSNAKNACSLDHLREFKTELTQRRARNNGNAKNTCGLDHLREFNSGCIPRIGCMLCFEARSILFISCCQVQLQRHATNVACLGL